MLEDGKNHLMPEGPKIEASDGNSPRGFEPPAFLRREYTIPIGVFLILLLMFTLAFSVFVMLNDYPCTDAAVLGSRDYSCGYACGRVCVGKAESCFATCYASCAHDMPARTPITTLNENLRLDSVHHVGITVSNLSASVAWYTQILGGVEVQEAGGNIWTGDDLEQALMQHEILSNQPGRAALGASGTDTLATRYVSFGNIVLEFLEFRQKAGATSSDPLPHYHESSAMSYVNNMHLSFYLTDEADMNAFILAMEQQSKTLGFTQVRCNRAASVTSEQEREALGQSQSKFNSYSVSSGPFRGYALAYCKGPDGEQLEFNQVTSRAKAELDDAMSAYLVGSSLPSW